MISTKENARRLFASEFSEVELVARDAEVLDDVGNDAARHVAWMPGKSDDAVGTEGIGIVAMASGVPQVLAADFAQTAFQLAAVERGIFADRSGGQHKFVAKRGRNGAASFQQGFQMGLGGHLKLKDGLAAVATVSVAAGEQGGFGNPHTVLVAPNLNFGDGNYHNARTVTIFHPAVNSAMDSNNDLN